MSVYTDISAAARRFLTLEEPFTEIDILGAAALDPDNYADEYRRYSAKRQTHHESPMNIDEWTTRTGRHHAHQVLASMFRSSKVVRFGPVRPPGADPDYLRRNGDMVHLGMAVANRKREITTPNGTFPIIVYSSDPLYNRRGGRPKGVDRDDFIPWDEQGETQLPLDNELSIVRAERDSLRREVKRLKAELMKAEAEGAAVAASAASGIDPDMVEAVARRVVELQQAAD